MTAMVGVRKAAIAVPNVGISRGQYAAYIVRSRVLTDFAPASPDELISLGAFLRLHQA